MGRVGKRLSSFQIIILGFAAVILSGALFLMLPGASRDGNCAPFGDALFTSVSAVCVTGLVVRDTARSWSLFGQCVILFLIQIGGLGVVTAAVALSKARGERLSLKQRSTMQEAISAQRLGGLGSMTGLILKVTLVSELFGALCMAPVFCRRFGFEKGMFYSLFHAVSAFCNAGFDLMGRHTGSFSSLCAFSGNLYLSIVICALIVAGGLGFLAWEDIAAYKLKIHKYRMQTKVIIASTAILILVPTILFFFILYRFDVLWSGISMVFRVLRPLLIGCVFAFLMNPMMRFMERHILFFWSKKGKRPGKKGRNAVRVICVVLSAVILVGLVAAFFSFVAPQFYEAIRDLMEHLDEKIIGVIDWADELTRYQFTDAMQDAKTSGQIELGISNAVTWITNYLNVDNWEAWNCPLTIESSNEDVISVEGDYLHALSRDKATIKVRTENGKTASADFYAGNYAQSITRDSWERIYLKLNDRQSLSYRLEPEGGDFSDEEVIWTVNDYSNCISFNEETREVTATGYGTASINARIQSGSEVNYDISVYKEPETLEFKSKQNYVKLYYSYDIREFLDITPAEAYYCPITISTPDPDAIWTGDYFIGTGQKGTVTIGVATGDTQWDTADFTVGDFANGISPDGDNYRRVHVDNETQFSYQLYAWDNNYEDEVVTWTIESGEDVVSLLDQNGNVKALAPGNAVIHASIQDGTYAEYYVEVPVPVERFELNPDSDIMPYGDAWYVWDRVSYEPNDADLSDVIIESDHPEIIDVQGEWMYANSTGTAKITLDAGNGVVSSFDITVIWFAENIMPTGQDLIYLETGKSTELGYSLYPFDSNEKPVWTVDDGGEQYVTVDENGLVTGVSPGQATVRGTIRSGSSVVYTVNVADPVTKIDFNTEEITVNRGEIIWSLNLKARNTAG